VGSYSPGGITSHNTEKATPGLSPGDKEAGREAHYSSNTPTVKETLRDRGRGFLICFYRVMGFSCPFITSNIGGRFEVKCQVFFWTPCSWVSPYIISLEGNAR
jgi:hypothetical protein